MSKQLQLKQQRSSANCMLLVICTQYQCHSKNKAVNPNLGNPGGFCFTPTEHRAILLVPPQQRHTLLGCALIRLSLFNINKYICVIGEHIWLCKHWKMEAPMCCWCLYIPTEPELSCAASRF